MPSSRFAIHAFKNLPGIAEIVALGRVRRQPGSAIEAEIEVLLASNLDDPGFDPAHDVHRRWVGCGQLDLLTVGSRWDGQRRAGETQARRLSGSYGFRSIELLGVGSERPVDYRRRIPTGPMAKAPCFLLERDEIGEQEDGGDVPRKILLPQIELVRALFGVSSRLLIELIDGLRDPMVADRGILDRRKSGLQSDGTVKLVCWRRPTDEEALILAAMIADPALTRLHDEVFQQLAVQREYREDKPTWPRITWPFTKPIALTAEGRWFEREDGFARFLVTRVTEIGLELSFSRIEVRHPGVSGELGADRLPPPTGRMRSSNARLVVLTTGRAPSPSRRPAEIASAPVSIPASRGVSIDFVAERSSRPRTSTLGEEPREQGDFSTAGRERGADPAVGRAEVHRMVGGDAETASSVRERTLRATWAALSAAAIAAGWRLTPYPIAGTGDMAARDGGFDFRREGILAGVDVGERQVIFADERAAPDDPRSLGILVKTMPSEITGSDIRTVRGVCHGCENHWGNRSLAVDGFTVFPARRRGAIIDNPEAYAALLRGRIANAVRDP